MPRYPAKQRPTAGPKLNPKPVTKLTERLAEETVHGHAPIHGRSANPRTNIKPARWEKTFSDGRPPWSAYEGRAKGGRLNWREEVTSQNGLVAIFSRAVEFQRTQHPLLIPQTIPFTRPDNEI